MTDRELLELAARAAGMCAHSCVEEVYLEGWGSAPRCKACKQWNPCWNPLADDGDALRLAVKLKIDFRVYGQTPMVGAGLRQGLVWLEEIYDADPYAATRRAIVRAAAALSQPLPHEDAKKK